MWPNSYFPSTYFTSSYWEKVGAVGAVAPVTASGTGSQLLPLMGIGCWLLLMILGGSALADESPPCTTLDNAQKTLAKAFHEQPTGVGLSGSTALLLLVSADGHFTLLAVDDDGKACLAAMGVGWHALKPKVGEGE